MVKIGIIGAGISGLSTAYNLALFLEEHGEGYSIDIYEADEKTGGTIRSVHSDGFIVETGPNGFLDSKPWTLELCERLDLTSRLLPANGDAKRRYVFYKNKMIRVPEKPAQFLKSDIMSFKGKIRLFMEGLVRKGSPEKDETIAEFGKRRIGKEAVDNLLDPMVTGIFAGDPYSMSLKACFPRIWEMEQAYGTLTKALIQIKKKRKTSGPAGPGGVLTSFAEGTEFLIKALSSGDKYRIKLNTPVETLEYSPSGWTVNNNSKYDVVVSAVPSYVLANLAGAFSQEASNLLLSISYSPMAVLGLGFKKAITQSQIDGFGFLIPEKENRKILGCLFSSNIFPNRAPKGYDLLQVMLGGARFTKILNMKDEKVRDLALSEIKSILNLNGDPDFIKMFRWDRAIPQYRVGHLDLLGKIKNEIRPFAGLFFTGNAYYGIGINDCTRSGHETADQVVKYLSEK